MDENLVAMTVALKAATRAVWLVAYSVVLLAEWLVGATAAPKAVELVVDWAAHSAASMAAR